jgi:hypothetical protein
MIEMSEVTKTYSGETGCACGCGGTYAYMPGNNPGYAVEPNERTVKMRTRRMNKALAEGRKVEVFHYSGESIYELENEEGTRVVRVYVSTDQVEVTA